jgi:hypothetical protein
MDNNSQEDTWSDGNCSKIGENPLFEEKDIDKQALINTKKK